MFALLNAMLLLLAEQLVACVLTKYALIGGGIKKRKRAERRNSNFRCCLAQLAPC